MLSKLFLGLSLVGAEWVLYLLLILSVVSVAIIFERWLFYRNANKDLPLLRDHLKQAVNQGKWDEATRLLETHINSGKGGPDLETKMAQSLIAMRSGNPSATKLTDVAHDAVLRAKLEWERNLVILATIGSNAPFIGLFGTVLGIIKAFHDLSQQAATGAQTVTAGISEALVATAIGILVAIPAVVAFNLFQRKVKTSLTQAEALKSYMIGRLTQ